MDFLESLKISILGILVILLLNIHIFEENKMFWLYFWIEKDVWGQIYFIFGGVIQFWEGHMRQYPKSASQIV